MVSGLSDVLRTKEAEDAVYDPDEQMLCEMSGGGVNLGMHSCRGILSMLPCGL